MSQTTRCPACHTTFKLVPDQLRVSEGWVRCGRCAEVFEASLHTVQAAVAAPAFGAARSGVAPSKDAAQDAPQPASEEALETQPSVLPQPDLRLESPSELPPEPASPAAAELPAHWRPSAPAPAPAPAPDAAPTEPDPLDIDSTPTDADAPHADAVAEGVSFVQEARRRAFWGRPWVVAGLLLCTLAAAVGLAAQVAVHERNRLAAMDARLLPWLELACTHLDCKLAPWQNIEAVVIDNSAFTKDGKDGQDDKDDKDTSGNVTAITSPSTAPSTSRYRFSVALKNTSSLDVAMPALELSLTDTQDQPVLRRVFLPSELGAAPVLRAGSDWAVSLPLAVVAQPSVAGYRVLAFYP
jgi:predicted Zn finger-like uncharacterized protein